MKSYIIMKIGRYGILTVIAEETEKKLCNPTNLKKLVEKGLTRGRMFDIIIKLT